MTKRIEPTPEDWENARRSVESGDAREQLMARLARSEALKRLERERRERRQRLLRRLLPFRRPA
jgi:hypothetical protein